LSRVFILEDDLYRVNLFRKKLAAKHTLTITDNVFEAKKLLAENDFDVLFLDHDLGGEIFVDSSAENTGYQLAKWLEEQKKHYDQIIIHSCNPVGADMMAVRLDSCTENLSRVPFPLLINYLEA